MTAKAVLVAAASAGARLAPFALELVVSVFPVVTLGSLAVYGVW
jgi:hypothetical protein